MSDGLVAVDAKVGNGNTALSLDLREVGSGTVAQGDTLAAQALKGNPGNVPDIEKPKANSVTEKDTREDIIEAVKYSTQTERIISAAIQKLAVGCVDQLPAYEDPIAETLKKLEAGPESARSEQTEQDIQMLRNELALLNKPREVLADLALGKKIPWGDLGAVAEVADKLELVTGCRIPIREERNGILNSYQISEFKLKTEALLKIAGRNEYELSSDDRDFFTGNWRGGDCSASTVVQGLLRAYTIVYQKHPDVFEHADLNKLFKNHVN